MPEINDVLDNVQREVKAFGDDVAGLKASMEKDLAAVRAMAEQAGKGAVDGTQIKKDLDALTQGIAEKQAAIEAKVKEVADGAAGRLDEIERKVNRSRLTGSGTDDVDIKSAREFHRTVLAGRGQLKVDTDLSDDNLDLESIKAYSAAFPLYLRRGENGVDMKAMSVGSDPDGGQWVEPQMGPMINGVIYETSPLRGEASVVTIGTDAIEFPRDDDEASCGWIGETTAPTDTATPQVGTHRIPVHEMYAMPKATQKLLEDAAFGIEPWLANKIGEKFGRTEATAFVSGDGVNKPRGFLTYASGTFAAGGSGKIEQVNSGLATDFTVDGLISVMSAMKEFYAPGAKWLMRRATTGQLMLKKDGEGQYLWQPNIQLGKPALLLGHEVRQAADMPAVGAGTLAIAFGNFKVGYTIVDRLGISTLRDPYTAKPFVLFYSRKRVGGDVTNFEAIKLLKISA